MKCKWSRFDYLSRNVELEYIIRRLAQVLAGRSFRTEPETVNGWNHCVWVIRAIYVIAMFINPCHVFVIVIPISIYLHWKWTQSLRYVIGIYLQRETAINPSDFIRYLLIYGGCHGSPENPTLAQNLLVLLARSDCFSSTLLYILSRLLLLLFICRPDPTLNTFVPPHRPLGILFIAL